ncbi:MAG: holo-ACP synthase [Deltaproteobacteria bacterium]|nr:holo-ACP synthase [Deltaproteobacteria bacterium]
MIIGVGHDLVSTLRFARVAARFGQRFLDRIFIDDEQRYCRELANPTRHFAARFAAKEAFYKALSRGVPLRLGFRDVGVSHVRGASLKLWLSPVAAALAHDAGVVHTHLSLSHDGDYAAAMVVLEGAP